MPRERRIRVRGKQREDIEVDLVAQIVLMMARQLAQEAEDDKTEVNPDASEDGAA